MQNGIRRGTIRRDAPQTSGSFPVTTASQVGPREPGVVYYDGGRLVEVKAVVTDCAEARRVLRRKAAQFAVLIRDLHTGVERYTGATWTGSDRVLKAVAA
jgi:hypothetical protein